MGRLINRLIHAMDLWLWKLEQGNLESRLQQHFRNVSPDSIVDIDKYLRCHGLMP